MKIWNDDMQRICHIAYSINLGFSMSQRNVGWAKVRCPIFTGPMKNSGSQNREVCSFWEEMISENGNLKKYK